MSAAFCGNRQKDPQMNQHQLWSYPTIFIFQILSDQGALFRDFFLSRMSSPWPHIYHQVCVDFLVPPAAAGWRRRHWVQTWELGVGSWEGKGIELVRPAELMALIILKAVERLGFVRWRQWSTQDFLVYIKFSLNEKGQKDDTGKCFKYIYWT